MCVMWVMILLWMVMMMNLFDVMESLFVCLWWIGLRRAKLNLARRTISLSMMLCMKLFGMVICRFMLLELCLVVL